MKELLKFVGERKLVQRNGYGAYVYEIKYKDRLYTLEETDTIKLDIILEKLEKKHAAKN